MSDHSLEDQVDALLQGDYFKALSAVEVELIEAAIMALGKASRDGRPKYPPYHWREPEQTIARQLNHSDDHIAAVDDNPGGDPGGDEDHLAHAIARLVIAYARQREGLP